MKKLCLLTAALLQAGLTAFSLVGTTTVAANSLSEASRASINASLAIPVTLVSGTAQVLKDAGQLSVTGIKTVGQVSTVTLRALGKGVEASVQISSKALEGLSVGVGTVLVATVFATGVLLVAAGKAVMFIPNEVGRGLLHHSRARE
ncbi:MAG: hypothetical protein JNM52_04925 [Betaproteobacteria bacterium]|nr:hypothetical protein [Betaproteobacteria bacterium]